MLHRAIELAEAASSDTDHGISEQALAEAADELGVDPSAVRVAAAEERLGVLDAETGWRTRLAGPGLIATTRLVDAASAPTMERIDQWLRRNGTLRRRRLDTAGLVAEYTRRSDAAAGFQRAVRSVAGREHLGRIRRLRVVVRPVGEDRCVAALVADLEAEQSVALAGGSTIAGVGTTASAIEALGPAAAWWWLGVPVSAVAGLGMMRWRAHGLPDVRSELDGVLERILVEDAVPGVLGDVRERLLGGLTRPRRSA